MPVDRPWRARGVCRARRRRRPPRGTQLLPAGCRRNGRRGRHVIIRHQSAEYSRTDVFFLCHTCGTGRGRRLGRHFGRRGLRGRGRRGRIRLHRCERRRGSVRLQRGRRKRHRRRIRRGIQGTGRGPRLPRPGRRAFHRRIVEIKHKRRRLGHRLRGARRLRRLYRRRSRGRHSGDRLCIVQNIQRQRRVAIQWRGSRSRRGPGGLFFQNSEIERGLSGRNCRRRRPGCGTLHRRIVEIEHERSRLGRGLGRARRLHRLYSRRGRGRHSSNGFRIVQKIQRQRRVAVQRCGGRSRRGLFFRNAEIKRGLSGRSCGRRRPGCGTLHRRIVKIEHERSRLGRSLRRRDRPNGCIIRPSEGSGRRRGNARFRHAAERRGGRLFIEHEGRGPGGLRRARRSRRALEGKIVERVSGVRLSRDGGIISAQEIEIQLLHSRERFIVRRLFFNRLLRGRRFFHRYILRLKARAGKEVRRRHKNTAFSKFKAGRKTPASPRRTGRAAAGRRLSAMALFYSIPHAHASPAGKKAAFLREV